MPFDQLRAFMKMSPKEFVAKLDKKITGQEEAKKTIAIAHRNRWRRMQLAEAVRKDITPKNMLMIGDTGVGKTAIIRAMADIIDAPLLKVVATQYTQVGYYGQNVTSIIHQLADITSAKIKKELSTGNQHIDSTNQEATLQGTEEVSPLVIDITMLNTAEEIRNLILKYMKNESIFFPKEKDPKLSDALKKEVYSIIKQVGYKGKKSRVLNLVDGFYNEKFIKYVIDNNPSIASQNSILYTTVLSFLARGLLPTEYVGDDSNVNQTNENLIRTAFNESKLLRSLYYHANSTGKKSKKQHKINLIEALLDHKLIIDVKDGDHYITTYIDHTIFTNNELVNGTEPSVSEKKDESANGTKPSVSEKKDELVTDNKLVIDCIHEKGIVFIDEIDKIADTSISDDNIGKIGVQRDLLALLDGTEVDTKYGTVRTENIMFITAGAFSLNKVSDLMPELLGRLPIQIRLEPMNLKMLKAILTNNESSPLKQHILLLETEGVKVTVTEDGIDAIARFANYINTNYQNMGARTLYAVIDKIFSDISFDAYKESNEITDFVVNNAYVSDKRREMMKKYDNEQFKQLFQQMYGV